MTEFQQIKFILSKISKRLEYLQIKAERSLRKAPEGMLILSSSNGTTQYFHKTPDDEKRGKYIQKKNRKLISSLAQKDYDVRFLKAIEKQRKQVDKMFQHLPENTLVEVFEKLPASKKTFVVPHILSDEDYIERWLKVEYRGKEFPKDMPYQITERGEKVRSKIEKIIADKLFSMGIPYRYEYPLRLRTFGTIYPDFTLLKIDTREEVYFEHFGMMDNPQYCQKAILKIQEYARNGIYPGKNLMITFETSQVSLDMKVVEEMLKEFVQTV